ncbi:MAG: single-stranded-DNA-specific exonuclease RecJ [Kiritimatiellae bacterium]|nr:single-stranded-DNA-specific exonuclease RecJ [Kiritimatiellia bacterium]
MRACGLPRPVALALLNRGISDPEAAEQYLNPRLSRIEDPLNLPGMKTAAEALWQAVRDGWPIAVYGDYDVDGITSTALLVHVLRGLGANATPFLPLRMEDGYGLSVGALERCVERCKPRMVVTVDCGTCSVEAVEWARGRGVDVVVTDHHEAASAVAPARAVVNPKLGPPGDAHYLAGVGVAFKLCHALLKQARRDGRSPDSLPDLRRYLDWVAVGTICDVVPLRGENRAFARHGLERLRENNWIGLAALMAAAGVNPRSVDSYHVGFLIGPRLNAAGRLGDAEAALELLLTEDAARAKKLAAQLDASNRERQKIEADTVEEASREIDGFFDPERHFGLVVARKGWHPGVVGIVASRLVTSYRRPAVVIAIDEDGEGRGSCRSLEEFSMMDGLGQCAGLLTKWGGHSMAAGVELPEKGIKAFAEKFNEAAKAVLEGLDLRPVVKIDAWIEAGDAGEDLYEAMERMRPFGLGNSRPVWGLRGAKVVGRPRVVGGKHLRLTLALGKQTWDAIAFQMGARSIPPGPLDIAFHLQKNTYGGRNDLEFNVQDLRATEAG